jgi:hypothetical protein
LSVKDFGFTLNPSLKKERDFKNIKIKKLEPLPFPPEADKIKRRGWR